jgi:hypothetical protein
VVRVKRVATAVAVLGAVTLASLLLLARHHSCPSGGSGSTATAAIRDYYRSCSPHPRITPFGDGDKGSTSYSSWHAMREFEIVYPDHRTRFVLVGMVSATSGWRVVGGEGSGP